MLIYVNTSSHVATTTVYSAVSKYILEIYYTSNSRLSLVPCREESGLVQGLHNNLHNL